MKEKSQFEKNAADKQVELLSEALNGAVSAGGHWLNATGKGYPKFYPKGVAVSPFNALFMALHSDKTGSKTNLFTLYSEAKARGESVREHEKGVPFLFYNWNKYVNRNNPNDIISRNDYQQLPPEERNRYKGIHNREIRTLFTIDQTLLPLVDKNVYETLVQKHGNSVEQGFGERSCVNCALASMSLCKPFPKTWCPSARTEAAWHIMTVKRMRFTFPVKRILNIIPTMHKRPYGKS